ncbi:MAG: hypothetical protein WC533_04300 [Candidatus Pacearchaeota archaeon]
MNKRGQTVWWVMGVVMLVLSFVLVMLAYSKFFSGDINIEDVACSQSINLRNTITWGPVEGGKYVPLQCTTKKICMTMSGDDCEEFNYLAKDQKVTKVKLDRDTSKAMEQIAEKLADVIYQCDNMIGSGDKNFLPSDTKTLNYCGLCARISFDDEAKAKIRIVNYNSIYKKLETQKVSSGKSMLESVYGVKSSDEILKGISELLKEGYEKELGQPLPDNWPSEWTVDLTKQQVVLFQMRYKANWQMPVILSLGGGVTTLALVFGGPVTWTIGAGALATGVTYFSVMPDYSEAGEVGNKDSNVKRYYGPPQIYPYDIYYLTADDNNLRCNEFIFTP